MKELINSFLEEAHELINDLEDSLLTLEETPSNQEAIHRVFRVMHTLKGSGGMFGFTAVSDFTHHLESIYFKIRSGELKLNKAILTLTLKSVDLIKELLKTPEIQSSSLQKNYQDLVKEIETISEGGSLENEPEEEETSSDTNENNSSDTNTFYIHFIPNAEILQNGTNPLYLIDELVALGDNYVNLNTDLIPLTNQLKSNECYVTWEVILATEASINDLKDVFIFVEDESKITIKHLGKGNLFLSSKFTTSLKKSKEQGMLLNPDELIALAQSEPIQENTKATREQIADLKTEAEPETAKPQTKKEQKSPSKPVPQNSASTIRVSSQKIETLMNLVSEMVTSQARLNLLAEQIKNPDLSDAVENLEKLTRQLRDNAFEISLIPIESMLTRFKRLIRDLSAELNKEVEFTAEGTDTELDKTIIENLSDPLMHIFRNAIDHGIENSKTRKELGKPEIGTISLKAFYSGTNVYIQITDDGRGINLEHVKEKAIQKGLLSKQDKTDKNILLDMITRPGFSTAKSVTDISGRGVGMDVVKKNIQKIHGELLIDSKEGKGTTFTLKLPLTLSIIDGLIVTIDEAAYIIPIAIINKIRPIEQNAIEDAFNNTLIVDNEQLPFVYLRKLFGLTTPLPKTEQLVVVNYGIHKVGIVVDQVVKQSQVVVKSIGKQFHQHNIISGASIMGNGNVALVLDTSKIIDTIEKTKNNIKGKTI